MTDFILLGQVPGTSIQISFWLWLLVAVAIIGWWQRARLRRWRGQLQRLDRQHLLAVVSKRVRHLQRIYESTL